MDFQTISQVLILGALMLTISGLFSGGKQDYDYAVNDCCDRGCGKPRGEGSNVCSTNSATGVCNAKQAAKLV